MDVEQAELLITLTERKSDEPSCIVVALQTPATNAAYGGGSSVAGLHLRGDCGKRSA